MYSKAAVTWKTAVIDANAGAPEQAVAEHRPGSQKAVARVGEPTWSKVDETCHHGSRTAAPATINADASRSNVSRALHRGPCFPPTTVGDV